MVNILAYWLQKQNLWDNKWFKIVYKSQNSALQWIRSFQTIKLSTDDEKIVNYEWSISETYKHNKFYELNYMVQLYLFSKIKRLKDQLQFLLRLLPQKCNTIFLTKYFCFSRHFSICFPQSFVFMTIIGLLSIIAACKLMDLSEENKFPSLKLLPQTIPTKTSPNNSH